ncbi:MAG: CocE/NonD family hydrolase [Planctomycetaceae bacterium]|nr:CocE/NonD family hydrolase [Planctomycetaceae bacterium]
MSRRLRSLWWCFLFCLTAGGLLTVCHPSLGQDISRASEAQLRDWLRQYPAADTDGDGRLSIAEAEAYRKELERQKAERERQEIPFEHEFTFAAMSDGVKIALAVGYPNDFDAQSNRKWPTVFTLCGYPSSVPPINPGGFGHRCVTVNASIRGSAASGGSLNPWVERSWQDGYEIIEEWIVKQPWSNGRVGIVGHSWPGLMGFLVATTAPPSLKAACVSGLIEDAYRGICRPGGVPNCGFPVDWLNSFYGLEGPFDSGSAAREVRGLEPDAYQAIVASRPARDLRDDMLWRLMHRPVYDDDWRRQSLVAYAGKVRAPILMAQSYQDEQTGPSGLWIWKAISEDVPKRLILSNGNHGITTSGPGDMNAWLQHWLLGEGDGKIADPDRRVQVYFETQQEGRRGPVTFGRPLETSDFPLPDTQWTPCYLRSGGRLQLDAPASQESPDSYRVMHGETTSGSERLEYVLPIDKPLAICGPVTLTLYAALSTIETDFFTLLADVAPDGTTYGLQRGLLRASHRQLDEGASVRVVQDDQTLLVRPVHTHAEPVPVTPRDVVRYEIEIPVIGHVFRPGHKLLLRIGRPPGGDPIGQTRSGEPSYRYDSAPPPAAVQVFHDPERASRLLLPVLPELPPSDSDGVPLDRQAGLQPAP